MDLESLSNGRLDAPHPSGSLRRGSQQTALLATAQDQKDYFSLHTLSWMSQFLHSYTISISLLFILSAVAQLWILRDKKVKVFPRCRTSVQMVSINVLTISMKITRLSIDRRCRFYTWRHLGPKYSASFRSQLRMQERCKPTFYPLPFRRFPFYC